MATVNNMIGSSLLTYRFLDDDGDVVALFKLNPMDPKLVQRCNEISGFFQDVGKMLPDNASLADILKINDEIEDKICYLLGYDAKPNLFGMISATSVMADGKLFAVHVVEKIASEIEPILKQRQSMAQAVAKHTAKYVK